jgi:leucyl-tRNA synthetase
VSFSIDDTYLSLTTLADLNPYYDSFVRWQMNRLHQMGKVKFGERYTIYSPFDGQPCMDHDRKAGEAVNPQEYTAVKMEVLEWGPNVTEELKKAAEGKKVWMVAATLRPETMYGQTNCFIGPNLAYGIYRASDTDLFIVTYRAARNMAYQGILKVNDAGKLYIPVEDKTGSPVIHGAELLGTKVRPPLGLVKEVYVLPMEGVLPDKVSISLRRNRVN